MEASINTVIFNINILDNIKYNTKNNIHTLLSYTSNTKYVIE